MHLHSIVAQHCTVPYSKPPQKCEYFSVFRSFSWLSEVKSSGEKVKHGAVVVDPRPLSDARYLQRPVHSLCKVCVFHQSFQTPWNNKSTPPTASCFHLFLGIRRPLWNTRTRFWRITYRPLYVYVQSCLLDLSLEVLVNYRCLILLSEGITRFPPT